VITPEQLQQHAAWLRSDGGKRIEAIGANLQGADFLCSDLQGADFRGSDLGDANLWGCNLRGANLQGANFWGANLWDANLRGANLRAAIGNMREIRSAQFDTWAVTWSADVLAIGCQQHAIGKWRTADPRWIAAMDSQASDWWARYGALALQLIDASPATGVVLEVG